MSIVSGTCIFLCFISNGTQETYNTTVGWDLEAPVKGGDIQKFDRVYWQNDHVMCSHPSQALNFEVGKWTKVWAIRPLAGQNAPKVSKTLLIAGKKAKMWIIGDFSDDITGCNTGIEEGLSNQSEPTKIPSNSLHYVRGVGDSHLVLDKMQKNNYSRHKCTSSCNFQFLVSWLHLRLSLSMTAEKSLQDVTPFFKGKFSQCLLRETTHTDAKGAIIR